jgi:hypothetical protein
VTGQASSTTGWRVGSHARPSSGRAPSRRPTFSAKVKNTLWAATRSHIVVSVIALTWVKTGSVSTRARIGIAWSHGRIGFTPDTSTSMSAVSHQRRAPSPAGPAHAPRWWSWYAHR